VSGRGSAANTGLRAGRRITDVNRSLLTPRWLLLHVLFLAAAVATVLLARWQWDTAHQAGGTLQNLGYAFQWPLFGGFTIFMWYRIAVKDRDQASSDEDQSAQLPADDEDPSEAPSPEKKPADAKEPQRRRRSPVPPRAAPVTAEEDPELAAYNEFLARLDRSRPR
jgi:DNA-binding transcriptional regulator of glucitol operon